jgi:hypothetical protein
MAEFLWDTHRQEEDLWFREACDAVAEPAARPVSGRVLRRLAETEEARMVWSRVAGECAAGSPIVFFESLVSDARWRTLVSEIVDRERHRVELRPGASRGTRNWLRTLLARLVVLGGR